MGARRLQTYVHLERDGQVHSFGPDSDVPDWAAEQITNPDAWEGGDEAPAKSASKAEWVEYAVSQGATREDAEDLTKDELVAEYGG